MCYQASGLKLLRSVQHLAI